MNYADISPKEWEAIERAEHDEIYTGNHPFFFRDDRIDPQKVLEWEDYCYKPGRRPDRGHRTRRLLEHMGVPDLQGKRILDVGCGNGQYSVLFALFGADVDAFDISSVGVERGRSFAAANDVSDRCRFSVQNASATTYDDAHFDIVVLHEVLHHAVKYPNVHNEILRVLKPGGIVVCAETLRGNAILDLARRISMKGGEAKGDVILDIKDLQDFAKGFSSWHIEPMSLLFMMKRVIREHMHIGAVRGLLRALKHMDDILLTVIPPLRRYCGECVAVYRK